MDQKERKELSERVDEGLEDLLMRIYTEEGIETGDITPSQYVRWLMLCDDVSDLFLSLIMQNRNNTAKRREKTA